MNKAIKIKNEYFLYNNGDFCPNFYIMPNGWEPPDYYKVEDPNCYEVISVIDLEWVLSYLDGNGTDEAQEVIYCIELIPTQMWWLSFIHRLMWIEDSLCDHCHYYGCNEFNIVEFVCKVHWGMIKSLIVGVPSTRTEAYFELKEMEKIFK